MTKLSETFSPFVKWGDYHSKEQINPDILEIEPQEIETFETEYSINARVKVNGEEKVLPLQSFESNNKQLYLLWMRNKDKIKQKRKFKLKTWLGLSKNKFPIRRFEMVFCHSILFLEQ